MKEQFKKLQEIQTIQQRSSEWYQARYNMLTSSDVAAALEANPYKTKKQLLIEKCKKYSEDNIINDDDAVNWGVKYEPIAISVYEKFYKDKVYQFGLIPHSKIPWLGASPDGIRKCGKMVEIKCVWNRQIQKNPPYYYWMQTQIQMEVCNLEECDLFECKFIEYESKKDYIKKDGFKKGNFKYNDNRVYWKLETYSCNTIKRDREWFKKVYPQLNEFWKDILYFRQHGGIENIITFQSNKRKCTSPVLSKSNKRRKEYNTRLSKQNEMKEYLNLDISEWVSATETRNHILNDPLLDYFNLYGKDNNIFNEKTNELDFANFIRKKGCVFEEKIIDYIYQEHSKYFIKIANSHEEYSTMRSKQTFNAMKEGVPIIYQGVLHDNERKTYGIPDLMVRSDYINNLFETPVLSEENEIKSSPFISDYYHYIIIDIKFAGLNLNSEGKYLLNNNEYPAYKGQICVYNQILGQLQGYEPDSAFILGRRIFYHKDKKKHIINNSFNRLAEVNFSSKDKYIIDKVEKAIKWVKKLKKYGKNWKLPIDINSKENQEIDYLNIKEELLPNMCNLFDHPWHNVKKLYASKLHDVTMLWNCGVKHRNNLFKKGIYNWLDIRCNSKNLGLKGKNKEILDGILSINRNKDAVISYKNIDKLYNIVSYNGTFNTKNQFEFYVDFETVNDLNDDFTKIPSANGDNCVFMIGVGWISPENNTWKYKSFVVNNLSAKCERDNFIEWYEYMLYTKNYYLGKEAKFPRIYHWGNAEKYWCDNAVERLNLPENFKKLNLFNLLDSIKINPIFIKGCLNFGLKNIANALHNYGFINTKWEDSVIDGIGAMVMAWEAQNQAIKNEISFRNMPCMKNVVCYNEVDCKVMWEIVSFIRKISV